MPDTLITSPGPSPHTATSPHRRPARARTRHGELAVLVLCTAVAEEQHLSVSLDLQQQVQAQQGKPGDASDVHEVRQGQREVAALRDLVRALQRSRIAAESLKRERADALAAAAAEQHQLRQGRLRDAMEGAQTPEEVDRRSRGQTCFPICEGEAPPARLHATSETWPTLA